MSIIMYYVSNDIKKDIENHKNDYLFFEIYENTKEALERKCEIILSKQVLNWQPLLLEHKDFVNMYMKKFYFKK